jgi:hypothetical protein
MRSLPKFKASATAAFGVVLSMAVAAKATPQALATYELLATGTNDPNGVISPDGSSVTLSAPGSQINVSLFLVLHGADTNAGNDGALNAKGSFVGPSSGLLGNFTVGAQGSGFGGPGFSNGSLINSNNTNPASFNLGDDTAVGTVPSNSNDQFIASSTNSLTSVPVYGTSVDAQGNTDILLGTTTFTLLSVDTNGTSSLNFIPTYNSSTGTPGRNQKFTVDANTYAVNALGTGNENGSTAVTGDLSEQSLTVTLAPEPASLGVLAFGGVAMMRRRRTQARK